MSTKNKLIAFGLGITMSLCIGIATFNSSGKDIFSNKYSKTSATINVNTPYSLIFDNSTGYSGGSSINLRSSEGNDFGIGFSNDGDDFIGKASCAFATTNDNAYIYTTTLLNGVSEIYISGTGSKTGVTVYAHYYSQTENVDDSETVQGALNSLITFSPTKYIAIEFEGTDDISSIEIGYSCSEPDDPCRHLKYGGAHSDGNGYYQNMIGLSTDLPVGTIVTVEMDVSVTGDFSDSSGIYWVDDVYTVDGGESDKARTNITSTIVTGDEGWHHISFDATIRNFSNLRFNIKFTIQNTSAYGNAVYLITQNKSTHAFNYKNVSIAQNCMTPCGNNGNDKDMYYQSITGLSTDLSTGSTVIVDMDVYVTGTFNSYSYIYWVDSVYSVDGGERNASTNIKDLIVTGEEGWHHVTFTATIRNFPKLRYNSAYPVTDTSSYDNAIYLIAMNKTTNSFNYKNVELTEIKAMIPSGNNGNDKDMYYQSIIGLSANYPVGTSVIVDMDVYVTGTFNAYSHIYTADSVYSVAGGELNAKTEATATIVTGDEGWHHVTFTATIRNFPKLRYSSAYPIIDTSSYGNAVYLIAMNKTTNSFNFKNAEVVASLKSGGARSPANGFYQSMTGLSSRFDVGTNVFVEMDVKITGSFNEYASIYCVDSVYTVDGGERKTSTNIKNIIVTGDEDWHHVTFDATVRNFANLRLNSAYTVTDTSSYGNAVYLLTENNSVAAFDYKNVVVKANIEKYSIVIANAKLGDDDSPTYYAANILKNSIEETGANIEIVSDETSRSSYEIVLGTTKRYSSGRFDNETYHLINHDESLHIDAKDSRGIIYGVYAWLESVGYRFYSQEVTVIPELNNLKIDDIDYTYTPEFNYREVVYADTFDANYAVSLGLNGPLGKNEMKESKYGGYYGYANGNGNVHNSVGNPTAPSQSEKGLVNRVFIDGTGTTPHPEYFAQDENGDYYAKTYEDYINTQVCLSNSDVLSIAKTYLIYQIQGVVCAGGYDGQSPRFVVGQMDNDNYCKCDDCMAKYALYGTTGAWLMWVNELARHVKANGDSRVNSVQLETLAYGWTKELPTGGVTPEDNVSIRFCSSFGGCVVDRNNSSSLDHEKELLEGWMGICDDVSIYYYSQHFVNYLEVSPNFDDIYYNLKYMNEVGVKGVYVEGFLDNNGEFGALRSYLISKMLQNPSITYEQYNDLLSDFCDAYYGAAGEYIVDYIELMRDAVTDDIDCREEINNTNMNITSSLKSTAESYWDDAESAVSGNATLLERVQKSRLHWTYTMLENYESDYEVSAYIDACLELAKNMYDLDIIHRNHASKIDDPRIYVSDYQKNPKNWRYIAA